jgi:hypothetical protein
VADADALPPAPVHDNEYVAAVLRAPVDSLPDVAFVPLQPALAAQAVAFVDDHVSVEALPGDTEVGLAARLTVGVGGGGTALMFTVTLRFVVPPAPVQASVNVLVTVSAPVV